MLLQYESKIIISTRIFTVEHTLLYPEYHILRFWCSVTNGSKQHHHFSKIKDSFEQKNSIYQLLPLFISKNIQNILRIILHKLSFYFIINPAGFPGIERKYWFNHIFIVKTLFFDQSAWLFGYWASEFRKYSTTKLRVRELEEKRSTAFQKQVAGNFRVTTKSTNVQRRPRAVHGTYNQRDSNMH